MPKLVAGGLLSGETGRFQRVLIHLVDVHFQGRFVVEQLVLEVFGGFVSDRVYDLGLTVGCGFRRFIGATGDAEHEEKGGKS